MDSLNFPFKALVVITSAFLYTFTASEKIFVFFTYTDNSC